MIKSVQKALSILTFVAQQDERPVSLGRIAQGVDLNVATCAHLVETLCEENYLEKVSRREGYIMGPQMHVNTTRRLYHHRLIELAAPYMARLCRELGDGVSISTMSGDRLYVPYSVNYHPERVSRVKTLPGMLYQSASGRVFLAYMTDGELSLILEKYGLPGDARWEGVNTRERLEAELEKIRVDGVCLAPRVRDETISALSCPVFERGVLIAAMGASMPNERFEGEHLDECILKIKRAARHLSAQMTRKSEEALRKEEET